MCEAVRKGSFLKSLLIFNLRYSEHRIGIPFFLTNVLTNVATSTSHPFSTAILWAETDAHCRPRMFPLFPKHLYHEVGKSR